MTNFNFEVSPSLTFQTVENDSSRLIKQLQEHADTTSIRVDLSKVTHCDSAGLSLLLEAKRLCNARHLGFSVDNVPPSVQSLARFCGVSEVLEMETGLDCDNK